ncbi:choline/glycine/proline betaine transport protein [Haloactinopolyspora alba]|uniref:Choline/glycine/proline betaine transport protein n=1 Tax=Haloactinopolyspora alba TaxID=648780 RepID=A0A2P8EC69_9ACTN|nr:BCCT family transporter [Haloactinopolyspora alba]PSL07062.1 choline/glycine/proline betaine transport protein [Haloactinopolyspora alba]
MIRSRKRLAETEYETAKLPTRTQFDIRPQVFVPAVVAILVFVILGAVFPSALSDLFQSVQTWISDTLGWFYTIAVTIFLVFVAWLALSPYGSKRLGPDDARPDYGYFSWFAMLFSAGMGIGLMFFSVAEPVSHFAVDRPPGAEGESGSPTAALEAMRYTFFHWGLHAWAIYIVVGLALCYFAYRRGLPLTMRSAFYPLLGDRIYRWPGDVIDTLAIVGTLFGVATSLGIGAIQINAGLNYLTDLGSSVTVQILLIVVITIVATTSVVLGLSRGIRRLSLLNVGLGGALMLFLFIVGPTVFIMNGFAQNVGHYLQLLPETSLRTDMFTGHTWQQTWTLFYWGWWISWSPFVGMFIARISRGRTIREFIFGVLLVPSLVTFIVLSVFGQTAFFSELRGPGGIVSATRELPEQALFVLLDQYPIAPLTSAIAILVIATFFITSSDSGSLVDDMHASGGSIHPTRSTRVFWALTEGVVAATLLGIGGESGLNALQQASIASGVPLAILLLGACWALVRALQTEDETVGRPKEEPVGSVQG